MKASNAGAVDPNSAIFVSNLKKSYALLNAVNAISFEVKKGSCFGLLGPNGAGKTTTLEMLEGLIIPDSGFIEFPCLPKNKSIQQHIGIQFQETALQDFIRVEESLEMFADLYGSRNKIEELIQQCHLQDFLDQDTKKLSGGQRQRLLLALALIHDPEILFLDEPTTGLDPQSRRNFWNLIKSIKETGTTIVLTTHYMDEAEFLCDDIAIMDQGKIIARGSPEALLSEHFKGAVIRLPKTPEVLQHFNNNQRAKETELFIELFTDSIETEIKQLIQHNVSIDKIKIDNPNLDDLFLKLTGHELRS